jgi:uncharacterized protein (TIGR03083 family)
MEERAVLAQERRRLASVLEDLTPGQWATPSLAAGWTVRHVTAHLVMPFRYRQWQILLRLLAARGDFDRVADAIARRDAALPTAGLVTTLRDNAMHPFTPPGAGFEAPLTDLLVHALDICRPLGIAWAPSPEATRTALDTVTNASGLRHFGIDLTPVRVHANDVEWSFGTGAPLAGSAADLLLVLSGRPAGSPGLTGAGASLLTAQLSDRLTAV